MQRHARQFRIDGFTLAELLIVIAIVGVLVAVAIPVFAGATASAEEATCAANRRSVKSLYTAQYLFSQGQAEDKQKLFDKAKDSLEAQNGELCPKKGYYTARFAANGSVTVGCSVHGSSLDDTIYGWIQDSYKDSWNNYWGTDHAVWTEFMKKMGWTEWPEIKGTDDKSYYLKFKGFTNSPKDAFLYAGTKSDPSQDDWQSRYVCDSAGKYGEPGQWYELPNMVWLTNTKTDDDFKNLLATGKPVNLVGDKFVSAS